MKELNPLMLALNNLDTRYIIEPKRKKKTALLITAVAAAAAMTMLTGFTVHVISGNDRGVYVNYDYQFDYKLTDKKDLNILSREELLGMGAVEIGDLKQDIYTFHFENALPSDVLKLYNADPVTLGNDKFTEFPSEVSVHGMLDGKDGEMTHLEFDYELIHKNTGERISLTCTYSISGYQPIVAHNVDKNGQKYSSEIIELNDGSECLVSEVRNKGYEGVYGGADLSYKGVCYLIDTIKSGKLDMDDMKQILSDLGTL